MSKLRKELLFIVALVILVSGVFIAPTIPLSYNTDSGVNEDCEVNEEVIEEQVEVALRSQFFENLGQVANPEVMLYGNIPGGMIGFAESRILLWMEGAFGAVTLYFEGARDVVPVGVGEVSHRTNYFLGDRGTYTNIQGFSTVVYEDLWPGIDLVYQTTVDGAKYEFRVAPGADLEDIRVRCDGQDSIVIGKNSLMIEKEDGTLVDDGLRMFQGATDVDGEFTSLGGGMFGFSVSDYDTSKSLIIDPLLYSTYVSGSDDDCGYEIAIDSSRNVYVTGYTESTDFPIANAYNTTGDESTSFKDVFVFKLSSDGSTLLYSTYVSGSHNDIGYAIAVDSSGNAYVTGYTSSIDFPTVNAYDAVGDDSTGYFDVFVFKLSSDGGSLLYSTYVSGSNNDYGYDIALDSLNCTYVTGYTRSTDFNTTLNAYNTTGDGSTLKGDAFVFRLNPAGDNLIYSTYISGSYDDVGIGIAVDSSYNAFITGSTYSIDFPNDNAYNATGDGSTFTKDAFVCKFNPSGALYYSTYVGGSNNDEGNAIAVDSSGNAYVTGFSLSADFPIVNAYNTTGDGTTSHSDVIVFKLSSGGDDLLYSTYVSGSHNDKGHDLAIDSSNNVVVIGQTSSTDFPTLYSFNETGDTSTSYNDVFVFKLSSDGGSLLYSTYVSGSYQDYGYGITIDSSNNAYITGETKSIDFPTKNALNATGDGTTSGDVFVLKLSEDNTNPDLDWPADVPYEQGTTGNEITWTAGDMTPHLYRVDGNGSTVDWTAWSNGTIVVDVDGQPSGVYNYTITVFDEWDNKASDTVFVIVEDTTPPDLDSPSDFTYKAGYTGHQIVWTVGDLNPEEYRIDGNGTTIDWTSWTNGTIPFNVDGLHVGIYNFTITVMDDYGKYAIDTVFVTVVDNTFPDLNSPSDFQYGVEDTGNQINWTVGDVNPGEYRVDGNGTTVDWTSWTNGTIHVNVDGLSIGIYVHTITVRDYYGNEVTDTVYITVVDTTPPTIDHPSDIEFAVGAAGRSIIWHPYDPNPASFVLHKDGVVAWSGGWDGSDIEWDLIGLSIDVYSYTLTVWDTEGHHTSDTVIVTVVAEIEETDPPEIALIRSPPAPNELDDVVVTATIIDENEITNATLQYSIDDGSTWTNVTMIQSTGTEWTGIILKQAVGVTVQYRIHARDALGNWGVSSLSSYVVANSVDIPGLVLFGIEIAGGVGILYGGYRGGKGWRKRRRFRKLGLQPVK